MEFKIWSEEQCRSLEILTLVLITLGWSIRTIFYRCAERPSSLYPTVYGSEELRILVCRAVEGFGVIGEPDSVSRSVTRFLRNQYSVLKMRNLLVLLGLFKVVKRILFRRSPESG